MTKEETDETNSVNTIYSWDEIGRILGTSKKGLPVMDYPMKDSRSILISAPPSDASGNTGGMKRMYNNRIKYRAWVREIKTRYGSITEYMLQERLNWPTVSTSNSERLVFKVQSSNPLENPADYKISWNNHPYGSLEPDVKHLIVWLKTWLQVDPETGRLLPGDRQIVQDFVDRTFLAPMKIRGLNEDHLRWFKNRVDLQSVKTIEHFHVLVKGVPEDLLIEWTGESEPVS